MSPDPAVFRRGVRVGIDVGTVRIGVARTDPDATLAVPVTTVLRARPGQRERTDLAELAAIVGQAAPVEVVVGLPVGLDGREGPAAAAVRAFVDEFVEVLQQARLEVPVRLVDERLTTAAATRALRAAGRDARASRAVVDQAAAVVIVQDTVDYERSTGRAPGTVVPRTAAASPAPPPPLTDPDRAVQP